MALYDGVRAGCVHEIEVPEELDGAVAFFEEIGALDIAGRRAVAIPDDAVGLGQDVYCAELATEEAVDEGGFSGVYFSADYEKER